MIKFLKENTDSKYQHIYSINTWYQYNKIIHGNKKWMRIFAIRTRSGILEEEDRYIAKKQQVWLLRSSISKFYEVKRIVKRPIWASQSATTLQLCLFTRPPPQESVSTVTLYGYARHKHPLCHPVKCFF